MSGEPISPTPSCCSFIRPGYPEQSSVAPQFKGLNPFVVIFDGAHDLQPYVAIENIVVLAIANLRFISVVLSLLVLNR